MRNVLRSRWFGIVGIPALVLGVALWLSGCRMGITKGGVDGAVGPSAWSAVEHGEAIAQEGREEGDPVKTLFGQILTGLGAVAVSIFGGARVTAKQIKRYDDAPYTAADAASIKAAADATPTKPA